MLKEKDKTIHSGHAGIGKSCKQISEIVGIDVPTLKEYVYRQNHVDVRLGTQCKEVLSEE